MKDNFSEKINDTALCMMQCSKIKKYPHIRSSIVYLGKITSDIYLNLCDNM